MARWIECVERVNLSRPVRKQFYKASFFQEIQHAACLEPRDPCTCQASTQHRAGVADEKASRSLRGDDLAPRSVLPFQRLASHWAAHLNAGMIDKLGRCFRPSVLPDVERRSDRHHRRLEQLACDEG